jgi:hypothetical protein
MAQITKRGRTSPVTGNLVIIDGPSIITLNPPTTCYEPPLIAGEPIGPMDACFINPTDSRVYRSFGAVTYTGVAPSATAAQAGRVMGFAKEQVFTAGEPVTLVHSLDVEYVLLTAAIGSGKPLFVSDTVFGGLADAATSTGTAAVAFSQVQSDPSQTLSTQLRLRQSGY